MPYIKQAYDQVSGLFSPDDSLNDLLRELNSRGYNWENLSLVMNELTRCRYFHDWKSGQPATKRGAAAGGVLGALVGLLMFVPGLGFLAAGPLLGLITGGLVGAGTGGFLGLLIEIGIPKANAKIYERELNQGNQVLLLAHVRHYDTPTVQSLFMTNGGQEISVSPADQVWESRFAHERLHR